MVFGFEVRQDAVRKVIARLEMGVPARGEGIYDPKVIGSPVKKSRRSTTIVRQCILGSRNRSLSVRTVTFTKQKRHIAKQKECNIAF
jgi:hypothetical protein